MLEITTTSTLLPRQIIGHTVKPPSTEYAKLPYIPPYLHSGIDQFIYGESFASAGSGALAETGKGLAIDLKTQLRYFKNVSRILMQQLGDAEAKALLSRAVYLFSVGISDHIHPYEEIYEIGGRKFTFPSLWPSACIPSSMLFDGGKSGACFDTITPYIELHNKQLSELLRKAQNDMKGFKYSNPDFHTLLEEIINHPSNYGFKEGKVACCGSGPYRGIYSCGGRRGVKEFELCQNVSEYVFFDFGYRPKTQLGYF
ncbi:hypothetical protein FNV43_RR06641 [Rhamnella rubrinervis]|uniref:Uncharacterized protein n=1 Tax=Rhamnella rubrinervis TaxID=2594499 RepID=A0A8K0HEY2_9ROSA|nr:hypothetical protein FNV43_RR06641 [Rhamnella rubrinervis]